MKKLMEPLVEVEKILNFNKSTRDDDHKLLAIYWNNETKELGGDNVLLHMYNNRLTSAESITRCRRKLQETHPELRGEKYEERQKRSQNIKKQIS